MGKNIPVLSRKSDRFLYSRRCERKPFVRTSGHRILSEIKCCTIKETSPSSQILTGEGSSTTYTDNAVGGSSEVTTCPSGETQHRISPVSESQKLVVFPSKDRIKLTLCSTQNKYIAELRRKDSVSETKESSLKGTASTSKVLFNAQTREKDVEEISKSPLDEDRRSVESVIIISDAGSDNSADSTEIKIIEPNSETEECPDTSFNQTVLEKNEVDSEAELCLKSESNSGDETVQVKIVDADGEVEHFIQTEFKVGFRRYHTRHLKYRSLFFHPKFHSIEEESTIINCVNLQKVPKDKDMDGKTEVNTEKHSAVIKDFASEFCQGHVKIQDEVDKVKEPMIGLAYIVEIWDNNKTTVKNYRCFLCKEALKDSAVVVSHVTRRPHGNLYMKTHFPLLKRAFPCETAPHLWDDSAKAAFDKCREQIEQVLGRQQLFITTYGFYLKHLKIIPNMLYNYQVKMINPEGLDETETAPLDDKENSDWFAISDDKKSAENSVVANEQNGDAKTPETAAQKQGAGQTKEEKERKERGDLYQGKSQIENVLKAFRDKPILGLNYILEMWDNKLATVRNYRCFLCGTSLRQSLVLQHVSGLNHNTLFMKKNFSGYAKLPEKPFDKWDQYDLRDFNTRCIRIEKACGRQEMFISTIGYYLANSELVQNKIESSFKAKLPNFARIPKSAKNEAKSDGTEPEVIPIIGNHGNSAANSAKWDVPSRNLIQINTRGAGTSFKYALSEVEFPGRPLPKHVSTFDGVDTVDGALQKETPSPSPHRIYPDDFHALQRGMYPHHHPPKPSVLRKPMIEHPGIEQRDLYHTVGVSGGHIVNAERMQTDARSLSVGGCALDNCLPPKTYRCDKSKKESTSVDDKKSDSASKGSRQEKPSSSDVSNKNSGTSKKSRDRRSPPQRNSDSRRNADSLGPSSSTISSKSSKNTYQSRSPGRSSPAEKTRKVLGGKKQTGFQTAAHPLKFTSRNHPSRSPIKDRFSEKSRSRSPASRSFTSGTRVRSGSTGRTHSQTSERRNRSGFDERRNLSGYSRRNCSRSVDRKYSRSPARRNRSKSPIRRNHSKSPARRNRSKSPIRRNHSKSPIRRNRSKSPLGRNCSKSPGRGIHSRSSYRRNRSKSVDKRNSSRLSDRRDGSKSSEKNRTGSPVSRTTVGRTLRISPARSRERTKKRNPQNLPEDKKKGLPERYRTIRRSTSLSSRGSHHSSSKSRHKSPESKKKCPHKVQSSGNKYERSRKRQRSRSSPSSSSSKSASRSSSSSNSSSPSSHRGSSERRKARSTRRNSPLKISPSLPVPNEAVQNLTALIQLLAGTQSNPSLEQSLISEQVNEIKEVPQMSILPSENMRRLDFRDKLPPHDLSDDWECDDYPASTSHRQWQTGTHFTHARRPDQILFPYASPSSQHDKFKKFMDSSALLKKIRPEGEEKVHLSYAEKNNSPPAIPAISSEALFDSFRKTVSLIFGSSPKTNVIPSETENKEEGKKAVNLDSPLSNSPSDDDPPVVPYKWDPDYLDSGHTDTECKEGAEGKRNLDSLLTLESILGSSSENKSGLSKLPSNPALPSRDGIHMVGSNENRNEREVIKKTSRSNTLYHHLAQNPEVYKREWQKFYVSQATDLMKAGKKPVDHDFNNEWIRYINSTTVVEHFSKTKNENPLYGSRPASDYFQISEYEQRQNLHQSYSKTNAHDSFSVEAGSSRSLPSAFNVTPPAYHENRFPVCTVEKTNYNHSVEGISSELHSPAVGNVVAKTSGSNPNVKTIAERLASVLTKLGMSDVPQSVLSEMLAKIGAFNNSLSQDITEFQIISVLHGAGYIN